MHAVIERYANYALFMLDYAGKVEEIVQESFLCISIISLGIKPVHLHLQIASHTHNLVMPSVASTGKNIWIASSDGDLDRVKVRNAFDTDISEAADGQTRLSLN